MTNDPLRQRVAGSSLLVTMIISLVIGLICSALILLAYFNLRQGTDMRVEESLARNLQSSINLVLEDDPAVGPAKQKALDLFGQGGDSAYIKEELWGLYDVGYVEVRGSTKMKRKSFFFGCLLSDSLDGCLYLAEHKRSLSLVGSALLNGKAYLPKAGVMPGYIDQRGYDYTTFVNGAVQRSSDSLPPLRADIVQYYANLRYRDSVAVRGDPIPPVFEQSFADSIKTLHEHGLVELSGVALDGHILIVSDSVIVVDGNAQLENVVLTAPVIRFKAGFSGRVQAFGSDSVIVEGNCHFRYPSSLVLVKKTGTTYQPKMVFAEDCLVEGLVLSYCSATDDNKVYTEIGAGVLIQGILYADGYLLLKGKVYGATLADYFLYRSPAIVYDNYLVDAQLDRAALPSYFAGPVLFGDRKKNRILQWVN